MSDKKITYKFPLLLAIALHIALFITLFLHFAPQLHLGPGPQVKIINATLVDHPGRLKIENKAAELAREQKLAAERALQEKQQLEKQQQEKILQQQQQKQQAAEKLQQQLAVQKVLAMQQAQQKKLAAEQLAKEKAVKLKQQAALAAEKKAAAQKALQKKLRAAQQQMLQQQIAQEQQQLKADAVASAHNQLQQNEIDKYKALIIQTIGQNWLVPDNADKDLSCQLLIQVGPGGVVLGVQVVKSSGNAGLDSSATAAVFKSSPLPVPTDPQLFDKFRQLRLTVKPENRIED